MKKILFIFGICLLAFSSCCDDNCYFHNWEYRGYSTGTNRQMYHCSVCGAGKYIHDDGHIEYSEPTIKVKTLK